MKINLKVQEDELKNCLMRTWKTSWKNDISFAPPPSPNKMSLLFMQSKFTGFFEVFPNLINYWSDQKQMLKYNKKKVIY